jgi:hypothetical protein
MSRSEMLTQHERLGGTMLVITHDGPLTMDA